MRDLLNLRIVVLRTQSDVWCDTCGVPSAVTVIYTVEEGDRPPWALHRVTYCEGCEGA